MKIGLLIAIERELKAFLESGAEILTEKVCGRTVYRTRMGEHEIFALCSGYGEIDAAAGTQLLIVKYGCERILNFGVTGALEPALKVEDLFVVRKVCHYDYDVSPIDPVKPHQYAEFPDEFIPLDGALIAQAKEIEPELRAKGCQICDMEIAAIARICWMSGVPCLSIKCISDTYEGDGGDFAANVERSAARAFRVLKNLITRM